MLTVSQLATVRAALTYWEEELGPHGAETMRPYLDVPDVDPVPADELRQLREQFTLANVRYAVCDHTLHQLAGVELFPGCEAARQQAGAENLVVTVLLPADPA